MTVANRPVIVVEVPPTTRSVDSTDKLADYFRVPSVQHYLVLRSVRREVVHHQRTDEGIITRIINLGTIHLDPPGFSIDITNMRGWTSIMNDTALPLTNNRVGEIELQIMWNRLLSVVEEQAQTLVRTAFSTSSREAGDISAGVFDLAGRMLAQAVTGTPGHINTMARSVGHFLDVFPVAQMKEGDVYVTNDPWKGTGHLYDLVVVSPTFMDGSIVALFACTAHLVDMGGVGQTRKAGRSGTRACSFRCCAWSTPAK